MMILAWIRISFRVMGFRISLDPTVVLVPVLCMVLAFWFFQALIVKKH